LTLGQGTGQRPIIVIEPLSKTFAKRDVPLDFVRNGLSSLSGERGVLLGVGVAALVSAALLLWIVGDSVIAAGFSAMVMASAALILLARRVFPPVVASRLDYDWSLVRDAADNDDAGIAITDRSGRLVCANSLHESWFGGPVAPPALALSPEQVSALTQAGKMAWRDGKGAVRGIKRETMVFDAEVTRSGRSENHLVWRFRPATQFDLMAEARRLIEGPAGARMGEAGIMACLIGAEGKIRTASQVFTERATGRMETPIEGREFVSFFETDKNNVLRFMHEGRAGTPLRLLQVPVLPGDPQTPTLILLLDDDATQAGPVNSNVTTSMQALMAKLPLGLALADRDGRFLFLNDAFCRAVGVPEGSKPVYPGDLVVREDKAAVADAVRRYAMGQPISGDIAVRLANQPEEPVALTIGSARGLGDAAVLMSIKDSSEESRLKKQVAQATKMQAVGQLAGGVAHDFNNILTGILGHCDLMMMRHSPGDSDYDDIQQIRNNANRAAGLTRQLLAFSRQQTLRPQVLQLPDVVSEISNLLKRLMGETVELEVKHGRNLGAVRADPGQLEQVIVNLAVNARDAMVRGGVLTIQTFAVSQSDVRKIGSDILPVADYTALSVTDTGSGIPPEALPKIFEPFFTTKEVGKGTGLGLSTVYGIVKQSGGFIFADSKLGEGTRFVIYLPVHAMEAVAPAQAIPPKEKGSELWGSGIILLVEDEDMVRAVAERALTRHGYQVVTAANGDEGFELLKTRSDIDMLVSDVVMPIMDGPTLGRHARELKPDMPILFMSGYAEEQLRKSISIENVNFLPKPFSVQQLAEAVRDIMPVSP
jgi:two-component system cell cycle sensor histidine kinase/response regulator CckA